MDTAFAATLDVRTGTASPARLARMQPSTPSTPSTPASMTSMAPAGYVLEDILGCGGMAVVHRAREVASGRVVALKLMRASVAGDVHLVARFRREVIATSSLDDDNVVRVLDFAGPSQAPYMVAELVDGGSLADLMARAGPMPALLAAMLVDDLLSGLAHAHEKGVVHRDLKPANLLLTSAGRLKVSDFGIATSLGECTLSMPGDIIGTPSYMSPEQALWLPVGPASDLFSVGTVLYELITGVNPFAHESQSLTLACVTAGNPRPIFEIDPTVPPGIERLLHALIEPDPASRCQSAQEALVLLRAARAEMTSTDEDVARCVVVDRHGTIDLVRANQAHADLAAAHALLARGRQYTARAAFLAFRATASAPRLPAALALHQALSAEHGFRFHGEASRALSALEAKMLASPGAPEIVKRAAVVARADGDLLRAAALFKRYLLRRPGDEDARARLVAIVGDDVGVARAAHHAGGPATTSTRAARPRLQLPRLQLPRTALRALHRTTVLGVLPIAAAVALAPLAVLGHGLIAFAGVAALAVWLRARVLRALRARGGFRARRGKLDAALATADTLNAAVSDAALVTPPRPLHTPRAFAAALRELSRADGRGDDDDLRVRALLERAACSLVLEERSHALADLDATLTVMPLADARRRSVTTIIGLVRHL